MNKYCTIYLVRHGETDWNADGIIQGHSDIPLNKNGEKQAEELGKELKRIDFDAVFSSDLIRAKKSAEIITSGKNINIITSIALRERDFGSYEGKHFSLLSKDETSELISLYDHKEKKREELGVETDRSLEARFIPYIREICQKNLDKNVLVVIHGGIMRWFLMHIKYGDIRSLPVGSISNMAYAKIESDGVNFTVKKTSGITKKE
ncbi:MAG: Phosphoglycerate mutase family protein [Candidatus Roizmanbacteria bacterium GW2011_GWA2_35_19]|uniref:Phosphoglycerate mutase family protein n=2 Tax=Candidatus Roizmaniibacteriota TaxID=1752723 RepID=A0A0G0E838_9BACT|nr:MAG: Phosphoglycerate mutase family protein [Candidatus Roizmanbacteria bacterium GW2011_GWC2_35_12]KKP71490.1 MAG: Phosphoglycerate mutase family protein [Candidatus Roizmanbacteria bacterium GW2011_GWA2_35_19]